MKKIILNVLIFSFLALPFVGVLAATLFPGTDSGTPTPLPSTGSVTKTANTIVNWLFIVLVSFAVIEIVMAAFGFMGSGGDPAKTVSARNRVLYAMVAIIIGYLAYAIKTFVVTQIGNPT